MSGLRFTRQAGSKQSGKPRRAKSPLSVKKTIPRTFKALRYALPQFLLFEILCKAFRAIIVLPLFSGVLNLALRVGGRGFVANGEIASFLFSPVGLVTGLFLFSAAVFFIYIEFSVVVILIYYGYRGERIKVWHALKLTLSTVRRLLTVQTLGFGVYTLVILPLADMGVVSSLLPYLNVPNFVLSSLSETLWGALLLIGFALFVFVVGVMLSYALPVMILENISFPKAVTRSRTVMKKTGLKRFLTELVFVAAWVVLFLIPVIMLAYIIDVKGFLLPNTFEVFTTFGIAWRAFACLLAVGVIWALQTLFMPLMLTIVTVTYLELDGSVAAAPEGPPEAGKLSGKRLRRAGLVVLGVFVVVFASNMINMITDLISWPARHTDPVVMGHRGSLDGVENTLEAVQGAIEAGADYVEIDVQLSGDGVPIVFHDVSLSRLSGEKRNVYELSAAELSQVTLRQNGFEGHIPTLEQVVRYSGDRIRLNIELKPHGYEEDDLIQKVMEVIVREGAQEQCVFQSLSYELVGRMKEEFPDCRVGYIVYGNLGAANAIGIMQLNIDFLSVEEGFATQRLLLACRKAGVPLFVWTVNDPEEMRRFWEMGVDGIITDLPELAREAFAS